MSKHWSTVFLGVMAILAVVIVLLAPPRAYAIPAFSRQYNTSCSTCHVDFPKLNDFGRAFKDAGFKFPKDDESMLKVPPVLLGAPAQSELWPHTIWPGKIPGLPPVSFRLANLFQVVSKNRGNFGLVSSPDPNTGVPPFMPRTDFQTGTFSLFTAGNFGSDIAFWIDEDLSVAGSGAEGGLGDGYLKFVNVSRFLHLPQDSVSVRFGQFELDLPFSQARSHNLSGWDIYSQANVGVLNALSQQFVNNGFAFENGAQGIEISGGHQYKGYHYSLAVVNQNTGEPVAGTDFVPAAADAFFSDSNFKDLYGRFSYRFNLEKDTSSRNAVQAASATGPRDHTYLSLGSYWFYGRAARHVLGETAVLTAREPFYRVGGDFSFNYRNFNLFGLYMYGRDHNLLPLDSEGDPILLPLVPGVSPRVASFAKGPSATFSGGFLQADYLAFPWMMLIMRYDAVNSRADFINGMESAGPAHYTRNRFTPGVQFLIHANIKAAFEYQIRPQQQIFVGTDPVTLSTVTVPPFRTNTVTVGLDFVY